VRYPRLTYKPLPDIIAAFDVNSKKLGEIYELRELFAWWCLLLLVGIFIPVLSTSGSAYIWFLWVPVAGSIFVIVHARKEKYMVERRHVAVARRGVYVDETDEPGSSSLAKRTVLRFDSIVSCGVQDTVCAPDSYSVVIMTRNTDKPTTSDAKVVPEHISHNVTGLLNGQAFVDLVSAMMEASSNIGPALDSVSMIRSSTSAEMV
jgi:TM2 domain-containing membrane protein YozV